MSVPLKAQLQANAVGDFAQKSAFRGAYPSLFGAGETPDTEIEYDTE